jgi:hypothetical protein
VKISVYNSSGEAVSVEREAVRRAGAQPLATFLYQLIRWNEYKVTVTNAKFLLMSVA